MNLHHASTAHEILGWASALLLALCALPQTIKTVRTGSCEDFSYAFLLLWLGGEMCGLGYVAPSAAWPLIANYACNIAMISIILRYKVGHV